MRNSLWRRSFAVHDFPEALRRDRAAGTAHKLQTAGGSTNGSGTGAELTEHVTHAARELLAGTVAFSHGIVRGSRCT